MAGTNHSGRIPVVPTIPAFNPPLGKRPTLPIEMMQVIMNYRQMTQAFAHKNLLLKKINFWNSCEKYNTQEKSKKSENWTEIFSFVFKRKFLLFGYPEYYRILFEMSS